jgi:endonuclease III
VSAARAEALARYVDGLAQFEWSQPAEPREHMGALLAEAVLQAGLNFRTVVWPRLAALLAEHPGAATTDAFLALLRSQGAAAVLRMNGTRKPATLLSLTALLAAEGVQSRAQLAAWLGQPGSEARLVAIKGIGPKSVDYMRQLCGIDAAPVDRHLRGFLRLAGVTAGDYADTRSVVVETARLKGVSVTVLDNSIWRYMAERAAGGRAAV